MKFALSSLKYKGIPLNREYRPVVKTEYFQIRII